VDTSQAGEDSGGGEMKEDVEIVCVSCICMWWFYEAGRRATVVTVDRQTGERE
jgi:hypothetical protein